jgi:hypothetical protein
MDPQITQTLKQFLDSYIQPRIDREEREMEATMIAYLDGFGAQESQVPGSSARLGDQLRELLEHGSRFISA